MQQLNQQDAMFVHSETARAPMHLSSLHLYDPATSPAGEVTFTQFVEHVRSRLPLARVLRRKLVRVPFDLDHPYWVEDKAFDLEFHVRLAALPAPGDWRALWDLAARHHAQPLDLDRPPWELYFIEGVDGVEGCPPGSFAMQIKIHHSAIDGISGIELMNALHDLDQAGREPVDDPWQGEDDPNAIDLLARTGTQRGADAAAGAAPDGPCPPDVASGQRRSRRPLRARRRDGPTADDGAQPAGDDEPGRRRLRARPRRGEAGPAGRSRASPSTTCCWRSSAAGCATTCSGATPCRPVPSSPACRSRCAPRRTPGRPATRSPSCSCRWRPTSPMPARGSPRSTRRRHGRRSRARRSRPRCSPRAASCSRAPCSGSPCAANATQNAAGTTAQIGNVCVTNVPGSQVPLYLCGAPMQAYYSLGPVYDNAGPIHLIVSYLGKIYLSVTTCREIVPDIEHYVDCLRTSWAELWALAAGRAEAGRARRRRRRRGSGRRRHASRAGGERADDEGGPVGRVEVSPRGARRPGAGARARARCWSASAAPGCATPT